MSKQRYLDTKFWDDSYIINKDPIEKLLFIYLLTNPLTNILGIYEISLRRIAFDTGIDKEMVLKILERYEEDDKVKYHKGYIALKNFTKYQKDNPKINKGIEILLKDVPKELIEWINIDFDRLSIDYRSLSHPNTNSNSNTNSNTNTNFTKKNNLFKDTWKEFKSMRTKIRKPMTKRAEELLLNKLDKLSNNEEEQIAILNQSIMNSWLGVFPLKGDYNGKNKQNNQRTGSKKPGENKYKHLEETYEV